MLSTMDLTIVIPAYNESQRIGATLKALALYFQDHADNEEIVVVDDGSEDGTVAAVNKFKGDYHGPLDIRTVSIPHQGKGAAVAAGVMEARGKWVLMTDADLSTPIAEWVKLRAALTGGARVAVGSRQTAGAVIERHQPWVRQRLGLLFGRLVRALFKTGVIDSQCGFKAFDAQAAKTLFKDLRARGYCFDVEVLLRARSLGYAVAEVPVNWRDDPDSKVRVLRDWPAILMELYAIRKEIRGAGPGGKGGDSGQ
jgi:dolichyl-phosphate beta-glucosyltransferase